MTASLRDRPSGFVSGRSAPSVGERVGRIVRYRRILALLVTRDLKVRYAGSALGYLWTNSGGRLPLLSDDGYRVSVALADVDNLVPESDVRQTGVKIGRVVGTGFQVRVVEPSRERSS